MAAGLLPLCSAPSGPPSSPGRPVPWRTKGVGFFYWPATDSPVGVASLYVSTRVIDQIGAPDVIRAEGARDACRSLIVDDKARNPVRRIGATTDRTDPNPCDRLT